MFITNNGRIDLAVMTIEAYEQLIAKEYLYGFIQESIEDAAVGNARPFSAVVSELRDARKPRISQPHLTK